MIKVIQRWDGINGGIMMYGICITCEEICHYVKVGYGMMKCISLTWEWPRKIWTKRGLIGNIEDKMKY